MNIEWSIKLGDLAIVVATLVAPFAAIQAQKYLERWHDKERHRAWVFRTLMATRALSLTPEHINALNAVPIDFNRDKAVLEAWRLYFNHLGIAAADAGWGLRKAELLNDLLHTMAKSLKYQFEKSQIASEVYSPQAQVQLDNEQQLIRQGLAAIFSGKRAFPMDVKAFPGDPEIIKQQQELSRLFSEWLSGTRTPSVQLKPADDKTNFQKG